LPDLIGPDANTLFTVNGFPMMPLNSGSNPVFNQRFAYLRA
jgi:hypothetical protein